MRHQNEQDVPSEPVVELTRVGPRGAGSDAPAGAAGGRGRGGGPRGVRRSPSGCGLVDRSGISSRRSVGGVV